MLVKDDVSVFLRQRDDLRRNFVAGRHFVIEAVALLVYQNRPAAADGFGNQVRRFLLNGWVDLDFAHIDGACANTLQQRDTAAGCAFVVSRHEPFGPDGISPPSGCWR